MDTKITLTMSTLEYQNYDHTFSSTQETEYDTIWLLIIYVTAIPPMEIAAIHTMSRNNVDR